MRTRSALLCVLLATVAMAIPTGASAATPAPLKAARQILTLTEQRLELMEQVMASKWLSRSPIQDPAQEATVTETAVAEAEALGVSAKLTRKLFAVEIAAAKEVQLGWGAQWLYFGAPEGLAAPELTTLRAELTGISKAIVAALPRIEGLSALPNAHTRLLNAAKQILIVHYLGQKNFEGLVAALLGEATKPPRVTGP
jgi:chorismate mutase-like protein